MTKKIIALGIAIMLLATLAATVTTLNVTDARWNDNRHHATPTPTLKPTPKPTVKPSPSPQATQVLAGWRSSDCPDGYQQQQGPNYWINTAKTISSNFNGSTPGGVWILGLIENWDNPPEARACVLQFPGKNTTTVHYSATDMTEAYLTVFDAAGIKVWLQCEPANADVSTLIDLVLGRYSSHPCVIGFGIDVEWYKYAANSDPDFPGKAVTNTEQATWLAKVQSYNPTYKLFLKHWLVEKLPSKHVKGVVYITDCQQFSSYNNLLSTFKNWGKSFSDAEVGFQYGYPKDEWIWGSFSNPMNKIGNDIIKNVPNCRGVYWVDFTIERVYPPA